MGTATHKKTKNSEEQKNSYSPNQNPLKLNETKSSGKEEQMNVQLTRLHDRRQTDWKKDVSWYRLGSTQKLRKTSAEEW